MTQREPPGRILVRSGHLRYHLSPEIEKDTSSRLNSRLKMKMIQAAIHIYRLDFKKIQAAE